MPKRPLDHPAHAASARISSPVLPPSPDVPTPLLGNLTPTQFMRRYWQKKPLLIRQAIPNVVAPLSRAVTAIVLAAIGVRFVFWRPTADRDVRENKAGTALLGFSVSAINPTLLLTWSAAVAALYSHGLEEAPAIYAIPFGLCAAAGIAAWFVTLAALFKKYGGKLPQAALTWIIRSMGLVLVVLALWSGVKLVRSLW